MDDFAKRLAYNKADAMINKIGNPDWITDKGSIENYYNGVRQI